MAAPLQYRPDPCPAPDRPSETRGQAHAGEKSRTLWADRARVDPRIARLNAGREALRYLGADESAWQPPAERFAVEAHDGAPDLLDVAHVDDLRRLEEEFVEPPHRPTPAWLLEADLNAVAARRSQRRPRAAIVRARPRERRAAPKKRTAT